MSEPSFNPGRYCGDMPLPRPDNRAMDDVFTPLQADAIRKMIKEAVSEAIRDQPSDRKGRKKQNFVGRVEEE